MVDLHAHLLPGVDDGPDTWEAALDTVRLAAEDGIGAIVSTPHMLPDPPYNNRRPEVLQLVAELKVRAEAEGIPIQIYPGGEVYLTPTTAADVQAGKVLTYCDAGRYILVELPVGEIPSYTEQAIFELQILGLTPIIAHPERNEGVRRDPERLFELVSRGVLTQLTASSLNAVPFKETAELLLRHGAVHFVASDTHGAGRRPPRLSIYRKRLVELVGEEGARRLLVENPSHVIQGRVLEPEPVLPLLERAPARRSLFGRLLGRRRGRVGRGSN